MAPCWPRRSPKHLPHQVCAALPNPAAGHGPQLRAPGSRPGLPPHPGSNCRPWLTRGLAALGLFSGLPPCPPPVPPSREKEGCSQAGARVAVVRSARPEAWMANLRGPGTPCCDRAVLCLKRATVRDYSRRAPLKYARCLANPVETTRCQVDSQAGARVVVVRPLDLRLFESTDTCLSLRGSGAPCCGRAVPLLKRRRSGTTRDGPPSFATVLGKP